MQSFRHQSPAIASAYVARWTKSAGDFDSTFLLLSDRDYCYCLDAPSLIPTGEVINGIVNARPVYSVRGDELGIRVI